VILFYGLNLSRKNRITILNRGQSIKCLPLLWERAQAEHQIEYFEKTAITSIKPHPTAGMILECTTPDGPVAFQADFLVGAIGREPALDFLSEQVSALAASLEQQGSLYFIGDVKNDIYRQTSISVGDGVRAAMQIYRKLKEIEP
jgi:thioredoxin reductase